MIYKGEIPTILPELTYIHPMTLCVGRMRMLCCTFFRPNVHNAQRLATQPARDAMHATINLAAHEQTLARALHDFLEAVRQILLPATEGSLESYQDLIDEKCRFVLRCLDEAIVAVNDTIKAFQVLEHTVTTELSRMWNTKGFRDLLPAIHEMQKALDAFQMHTAGLKDSAEHIPERFSLSTLAEFCGGPEHVRRELDFYIRHADGWRLDPLADEAQKWEKYARRLLQSPPVDRAKLRPW
ncbi:hypothetical protein BD626DRAFT_582741 [Schizophyllum amplum]|uniref:Uncharacterized protein n=1 Tax=Schizophyllum amplum TaxID=97359 RepID=A0A550CJL9_9AGAR|nr:hypothetical protein BD626DRAFT_582741 [Auriculariopsis ampla]